MGEYLKNAESKMRRVHLQNGQAKFRRSRECKFPISSSALTQAAERRKEGSVPNQPRSSLSTTKSTSFPPRQGKRKWRRRIRWWWRRNVLLIPLFDPPPFLQPGVDVEVNQGFAEGGDGLRRLGFGDVLVKGFVGKVGIGNFDGDG